jgi:hypothetical protein
MENTKHPFILEPDDVINSWRDKPKGANSHCDLRLVRLLRGKKAAEWGEFYASQPKPKDQTPDERSVFNQRVASFNGYLQALDDLEQNH